MTIDPSRVMIGFPGTTLSDDHWLLEQIARGGLGGVILYDRNISDPDQLRHLCSQLHAAAAGRQLVIAIDQEGGKVCRLKEESGFVSCPSAATVACCSAEERLRYAAEQAAQLADVGVTLNFAPVVDLGVAGGYIAAAERSYGNDSRRIVESAIAVVEMHRAAKIQTCLKHFPGHGSSSGDTHRGMVDITDTWSEEELVPFRTLISAGLADMVMLGHVVHREIAETPLSLSEAAVTMLRREMGYSGPIITDDLQMEAVAGNYSLEEAVTMADAAGVDWLLFANHEGDSGLLDRIRCSGG